VAMAENSAQRTAMASKHKCEQILESTLQWKNKKITTLKRQQQKKLKRPN